MNNKQKYIEFCKTEKAIPIFSKPFWLDVVCGEDGWDVILVEKGGEIFASMPYVKPMVRHFLTYSTMPKLTQKLGPYIKYPNGQKYAKKLSYEKEIMDILINSFPKVDYFRQNFNYTYLNWLPYYWKGYKQTTRYTYILNDISNFELCYENFVQAKKKNIKKAQNLVEVKFDLSADEFYANHKYTLSLQNKKIVYSKDLFKKIYNSVYRNSAGRTIYAVDFNGNIHAALLVIWDENSAYDLISTIDPTYRNSGAASLLILEMIKYLQKITLKFDFEGSMIENVENSFRQFGAVQTPYFQITKLSRKAKILYGLKNLANDIIKG